MRPGRVIFTCRQRRIGVSEYLVPFADAESEFTEKRSRFISHVWRVESEAEARGHIEEMKKRSFGHGHFRSKTFPEVTIYVYNRFFFQRLPLLLFYNCMPPLCFSTFRKRCSNEVLSASWVLTAAYPTDLNPLLMALSRL